MRAYRVQPETELACGRGHVHEDPNAEGAFCCIKPCVSESGCPVNFLIRPVAYCKLKVAAEDLRARALSRGSMRARRPEGSPKDPR
jgi:hypothetical protein